jgi:tRNA G18 (ribose-2'-O)-methylase SpoU
MEALSGFHCVREALRARRRRLLRVWIRTPEPRGGSEISALAEAAGVPVEWGPDSELEAKLPPGSRSQGLILEAEAIPELELPAAIALSLEERPLLVALDGVEDPQNVGAIARAAEAAGARHLDAASAAYRVGYRDASHFNREYKSLFGVPPMRDVQRLRETADAIPVG